MSDVVIVLVAPLLGMVASLVTSCFVNVVPNQAIHINRFRLLAGCSWWLCIYAVVFLLVARPFFSVCLVFGLHLLLLAVNHTKYRSLKEPFIIQDFEYFTDALRHPRLYIPFFGVGKTILSIALIFSGVIFFLWLEPSLRSNNAVFWIFSSVALFGFGVIFFFIASRFVAVPSFCPVKDVRDLGLFGSLTVYGVQYRYFPDFTSDLLIPDNIGSGEIAELPHRILVQSESFFDPRESYSCVPRNYLRYWDELRRDAVQAGKLSVPAWGANTVRTEASVLTGVAPEKFGVRQFNPYHYLSSVSVQSVASLLKEKGYRTICIHPYPASFYKRNKVMPNLGFDQFIDISTFDLTGKCGQYIGDLQILDKVKECLNTGQGPVFIFIITMENHGPLDLEQPLKEHLESLEGGGSQGDLSDLAVYIRHLKNADVMLRRLADLLLVDGREGELCWYGDHVPIMPHVYDCLGEPAAETPYLFWSTRQRSTAESGAAEKDLHAHELVASWFHCSSHVG